MVFHKMLSQVDAKEKLFDIFGEDILSDGIILEIMDSLNIQENLSESQFSQIVMQIDQLLEPEQTHRQSISVSSLHEELKQQRIILSNILSRLNKLEKS